MSLKTEEQLLAELGAAVYVGGALGKTTAPGLHAFLASLITDVVAARAAGPAPAAGGAAGTPAALTSPGGLTYRLVVADDGSLGTGTADGQPLPDLQQVLTAPGGLTYRLTVADDGRLYTLPAAGELYPEAAAFIAAADLRSPVQQLALAELVRTLKQGGVWPHLRAVYPMVGGTARAHALNLLDPRPVPEAFALQFYHTPLHTARGVEWNGTSQYADTGFVPATQLSAGTVHLAYYATTDSTANTVQVELGCHESNTPGYYGLLLRHSDSYPYALAEQGTSLRIPDPLPSGRGLALSRVEPNGAAAFYRDSQTLTGSAPPGWGHPSGSVTLAIRQDGYPSQKACGFASIGRGLTAGQAPAYSAAVLAFQQALGRASSPSAAVLLA